MHEMADVPQYISLVTANLDDYIFNSINVPVAECTASTQDLLDTDSTQDF